MQKTLAYKYYEFPNFELWISALSDRILSISSETRRLAELQLLAIAGKDIYI